MVREVMTDQREELGEFIRAADALRSRWLNDGHDMRDPSQTEFRNARQEYDRARAALLGAEAARSGIRPKEVLGGMDW